MYKTEQLEIAGKNPCVRPLHGIKKMYVKYLVSFKIKAFKGTVSRNFRPHFFAQHYRTVGT